MFKSFHVGFCGKGCIALSAGLGYAERRDEPRRLKTLSLKENCYDVVRLLLAATVVYSHSYAIGGFGRESFALWTKENIILGTLGVLGFFGLSGFLVTASFDRTPKVFGYLIKRVRRIFPGFWVCLLVTAFVIAPLIWVVSGRSLELFPWTGAESSLSYVTANCFLKVNQSSIQDLLTGQKWQESLNGPLWSLQPEFLCYLFVVAAGLGLALRSSRWLLALVTACAFVFHIVRVVSGPEAYPAIPGAFASRIWGPFVTAFMVGMCAYVWRESIKFNWQTVAFLGGFALVCLKLGGFQIVAPVVVTGIVLLGGALVTTRLKTDLSYGMYIYSFPLQILVAASGWASGSVWLFMAMSLAVSAAAAWLSWKLVERPALHRN
jgi:peptidoglycan/LPS O-acetylase OafA/YrhL